MTKERLAEILDSYSEMDMAGLFVNVNGREEANELIRLARLGLWAEAHGEPSVRDLLKYTHASTAVFTTNALYMTPAARMRQQADEIEAKDLAVHKAHVALKEFPR